MKHSPLRDLKIIDLSSVLAGPMTANMFSELGAKVLRIENAKTGGDSTRTWLQEGEHYDEEVSSYHASVNYNKSIVQKDLSMANDHQWLMQELEDADVLIGNFSPIVQEKLNLRLDDLRRRYPALIIGWISTYPDDRNRPAYDAVLQAETGWMSINGEEDKPPLKLPVAVVDVFASHQLRAGILTALLHKQSNQKGSLVEVFLVEAALAAQVNQSSYALNRNVNPCPMGSAHPNICPYGDLVECKGGDYLLFAVGTDAQYLRLAEVLEEPRLMAASFRTNPQRVMHRPTLIDILQDVCGQYSAPSLHSKLTAANIPCAQVRGILDAFKEQPHMTHETVIDNTSFLVGKTTCFHLESNT
jgi:crotonobetainyl-CoA:carnitine CoA-transferase CaiB-like acyl-CoA transferase